MFVFFNQYYGSFSNLIHESNKRVNVLERKTRIGSLLSQFNLAIISTVMLFLFVSVACLMTFNYLYDLQQKSLFFIIYYF